MMQTTVADEAYAAIAFPPCSSADSYFPYRRFAHKPAPCRVEAQAIPNTSIATGESMPATCAQG